MSCNARMPSEPDHQTQISGIRTSEELCDRDHRRSTKETPSTCVYPLTWSCDVGLKTNPAARLWMMPYDLSPVSQRGTSSGGTLQVEDPYETDSAYCNDLPFDRTRFRAAGWRWRRAWNGGHGRRPWHDGRRLSGAARLRRWL